MPENITRRQFLSKTAAIAALTAGCHFSRRSTTRAPNIILIMADDLGYGDLGCYGGRGIRTANIDRLAAEGVRFTSFYANAPECTPTRAALLTGRYQQRIGGLDCAIGIGNVGRYHDAIRLRKTCDLGLPVQEKTIVRLLKDAGYTAAIFGKWHLGYEPKFSPNNHGFDQAFYCIGGAMDYFHHCEPPPSNRHALYLNGKPIKRKGYFTDLLTDEAIQFIKQQTGKTLFFLYIPFTAPHAPYQGPADYHPEPLPENSELWNQSKGPKDIYFAMIETMDRCIGKILSKVEEKDLANNTLIIFMSDNGASPSGSNAPFSGYKGNLFEGGIRVPCIVNWPGVLPRGAVSEQPCMTMDFSASMVRVAGIKPPPDRPFDGIDILRIIEANQPAQKRTLFWLARRGPWTRKAVRDDSLKYISLQHHDEVKEYLFDLEKDPAEENNLISFRKDDARRLKMLLNNWQEKVKPER